VGTVRSRLSRARDALRTRLRRRGVTAPAVLDPLAIGLLGDQAASSAVAATSAASTAALPVPLSTSLARAATCLAARHPAAAGLWPAASMALARGVLTTMMLKKLAIAACALLPLGIAAVGGGLVLIRASQAQDSQPAPAASPAPAAQSAAGQP